MRRQLAAGHAVGDGEAMCVTGCSDNSSWRTSFHNTGSADIGAQAIAAGCPAGRGAFAGELSGLFRLRQAFALAALSRQWVGDHSAGRFAGALEGEPAAIIR